jgi:hypothetical protein
LPCKREEEEEKESPKISLQEAPPILAPKIQIKNPNLRERERKEEEREEEERNERGEGYIT